MKRLGFTAMIRIRHRQGIDPGEAEQTMNAETFFIATHESASLLEVAQLNVDRSTRDLNLVQRQNQGHDQEN